MSIISPWSIGLIASIFVLNWLRKRYQRSHGFAIVRQLAQTKRLARDKRRDELLNLLRTKYAKHLPDPIVGKRIYQSTAVELLDGLRKKDFTYTQVTLVLSLRALKVGQAINCTTEEFFDQAIELAEKFDENNDQDELLLKGIPISIKDHIDQQGADSSMGMSIRNFRPSLKDGLIIQLLKEQGALAGFVRTATIQIMMLPETLSETYGIGRNPFDLERTPGGSFGGEGALIAARGAPLGIGSDIGGSIRIPAHFCGIFGFKPTPGRLTGKGLTIPSLTNESGESNIRATIGPLARCTDDLVLVMRSLLQENAWLNDPQLIRQPWRDERFKDKKRLTIGFYTNDGWFSPAPACIRAVNEAADALRQLGHTVVPYTPIDVPEAVRLFVGIIGADGNRHLLESLENEEINPLYTPLLQAAKIPNFLRPFIARIMRLIGEQRNALIVEAVGSKTAYEYFDLVIDFKRYVKKWLDDLRENNIDLLLTPANGLPAYRHGQSAHLFVSCSYTFLFNILHFPAGIVPMTLVRDDEQYYEDIGNLNNDRAVAMAKDVCRQSAGLPIGIQLIGWPNDDERVLSVMKELENATGKVQAPMPKLATDIDIYTD
jgi:fatty acid amide hydrolase